MTDTGAENATPVATKIEFVQSHQAPLPDGDYQITLTQTVTISGAAPAVFKTSRQFAVRGPRYTLAPAEIHSVFPPEGSLGEHSNVLPHVVLQRSTLPWERSGSQGADRTTPWLALLLFAATETPVPTIVTVSDLRTERKASPWWPEMPKETGEDPTAKVMVIDVKKPLLAVLLPTAAELAWLAHVRRGTDDHGKLVGDELAVIIGSRLPAAGAGSTVHLVSLEKRYSNGSFDFQTAGDDDAIRLISLKSWSFACVDEKQSFSQLLLHLDRQPATLQLPATGNAEADSYLATGFVPLPHTLREGSETVSWYHGPLIPWDNAGSVELPVRAADGLVRFDPANGMFDVSHAAAWELGRLLTLQSRQVSTSLYLWKRTQAQQLRQAEQQVLHLPFTPKDAADDDLLATVEAWFAALNLLQGVPFNYLVAGERMLPPESIRFFRLDPVWMDCLLDGAFSIGRVITADHQLDQTFTDSPAQRIGDTVTGFLMRSDVVSGWPTLQADGYTADVKLTRLRMDRLSPNVLICLFAGEIDRVAFHQEPETLHFGLDRPEGTHTGFFKKLRDAASSFVETDALTVDPIPWRDENQRVLDVSSLATAIRAKTGGTVFTSAQLALQMVEGVEEVVLNKSSE
ncbi:MAG TPA: hypothetical protein VIA62_29820 [Thermoanaerobaculia bacterium]|jgi:hypothetical protein|nr:hypothetical protein [Thermoanaerobaculia bacterium]